MRSSIGKPKKRTTVYLETDLLMELKLKAARTGHKVSDLINDALAKYVRPGEAAAAQKKYQDNLEAMLKAMREVGKPKGS